LLNFLRFRRTKDTTSANVNETRAQDSRSDEALIGAVNHGDIAAFEALYYRYRDWVVHMAFRFTGDRDLALDVLQETFLYFSKKFPGFRLRAKLTTFLYPAVRNYSIAARRKQGRFVSEEVAREMPIAEEPEADLREVLAGLPEDQRQVLLLRFVDGMSMEEIAAVMRIPAGTVKSRLHYALKALRENETTKELFKP
jgi:RNA polymerase sigma-70 factor (ECF subfamily)